ncbi:MAG TPA: LysE family translocator [Ramlibacter sp.]
MENLWIFALLVLGIIAMPGVDMAFVLSSSLVDGRKAGAAAVAGLVAGGVVHVVMGSLGAGVLLRMLPGAYNLVLVAGALYVGWMGWQLWRHPSGLTSIDAGPSRPPTSTFVRAMATCLLNPKAYLFMVAVFPQFIDPTRGSIATQAAVLGAIIAATQLWVYGVVAYSAASFRETLLRSPAGQVVAGRCVAGLLLATAAWTLARGWGG